MRNRPLRSVLLALGVTCAVAVVIGLAGWVYAGPASATASRGCAAANYPGGIANHPGGNCHVTATTAKPVTVTTAKPKPVTVTTAKPKPKATASAAAKPATQPQTAAAAQQSLTTVVQIKTDDGVPTSSTPQILLGVLAVVLIGGATYRLIAVRSR
jgi:cobalamin biosynthesis Mg chelatase CobN